MSEATFEPHETEQLVRALATLEAGSTVRLAAGRFVLSAPIYVANEVSIVGERGRSVLVGNGEVTLLVVQNKDAQPTFTVMISGITFDGGDGLSGGAISCNASARLFLHDCRFVNNRVREDGGAIFLRSAWGSEIVRCSFEGNRARRAGGALDVGDECEVALERCVFSDNEAMVGGAVFLHGTAKLQVRSSTFVENRASASPLARAFVAFVEGVVAKTPFAHRPSRTP